MGIPRAVEPVKIGFIIGDPFLDRLPRRFDGFHRLDVKWRWWWTWELDDAFPKTVEEEKKFDLFGAFDGTDDFHGSFATGALERGGSPDFEDEVAPEGTHGAGALLWRGRDEEDFRLMIVDFGLLI